ncbi:restriction endonuclease subunit S [Streptomyces tailanensis]|uniref:restriction endonuclease subunit S n=1 Tax=Streptomyces tailanensis TaxID=2569858 RepID=UPI00122E15EE|nr:restriction endonuclease subunit S [Streptomyces tailanensis]
MSAELDDVRWVPVGEVGEVRMGKQLSPASKDAAGQMPYLRVANVFEGHIDYGDVKTMGFTDVEKRIYELHPGDILLNEGQESLFNVGRSAIYTGDSESFCFQNTLIRFRPHSGVLPDYAQEIFVQWRRLGRFASVAEKTSISHLGGSRFAKMPFPLIPLEGQHRIVEVLEGATESERASKVAVAKLRSVRRGLVLNGMAAIEGDATPRGWERVPLKEVVPSADYGISVALNSDASGTPTLRMNNLRDGRPDLRELRYSPQEVDSRHLLRAGDVLFNRTNSIEHVGRAGIWGGELEKATFASYLVRLNPDTRRLDPRYLVEWLQHPVIRQRVRSIATVAVQQVNVNPSRLRELEIDLPVDLSDQAKLVSALDTCDQQIAAEIDNLEKIRTMKQGLAAKLLSGKLTPAAA